MFIQVKFRFRNAWSVPYTYKTTLTLERGDIVVVPTNDFYNIAVVTKVNVEPISPDSSYKNVFEKLKVKYETSNSAE